MRYRVVCFGLCLAALLLISTSPAFAVNTCQWTGAGPDNLWSTPANWTNCGNGPPQTGDSLVFPAGAAQPANQNDLASDPRGVLDARTVTIAGPGAGNVHYELSGRLFSAGSLIVEGGNDAAGIGAIIRMDVDIISWTVTIRPNTTLGFFGRIGAGGFFSVIGGGTLVVLNGRNNWIDLAVTNATVIAAGAGVLPPNGDLFLRNGTLNLGDLDLTVGTLDVDANSRLDMGAATLTFTQTLDKVFAGRLSGTGRFVKNGPAILTMSGAATNDFTGTAAVNEGLVVLQQPPGQPAFRGPVVVNGGSLVMLAGDQLAHDAPVTINAPGAWNLQESDQTIGSLAGTGVVVLGLGTLRVGSNGASTTYAGTFRGGGPATHVSLIKEGAGTWTLANDHTFNGATQVLAGRLIVNGTMNATSPMIVAGGMLGGSGTVGPLTCTNGGGVEPGPAGGGSAVLRAASLAACAGFLNVDLNGPTIGTEHDQLDLAGDATLSPTETILRVGLRFTPPKDARFSILRVPAGRTIAGHFVGLPEGGQFTLNQQRFQITYQGGAGNHVVLIALEDGLTATIDDATITEGSAETPTDAVFTVTLSRSPRGPVTIQYATADGTATSPQDYTATSGSLTFAANTTTLSQTIRVPVKGDRNKEADEQFVLNLSTPDDHVAFTRTQATATIVNDDTVVTYYLSEGATGAFFDEDVLIANPHATDAPVTLTFSKENGEQIVQARTVPAHARLTVHVDQIPGLEETAASAQVTSESGLPLLVERSMFWDAGYYAGHTGSAVDQPAPDWFFAEGSQGFFDTFVLVINPNPTPADVTFTFLLEDASPVTRTITAGAATRVTLYAGDVPELVDRSFGIAVHATQPIMAERSIYFGTTATRLWSAGTESAGVTAPSTHWFLAEGATGGFFDTFVLLSNPQATEAQVTLQYLLDTGATITVPKTIPAHGRLTTNIEAEADARLRDAAVSTVVSSDVPIIAERSMYWPGAAIPWGEGHNSFGVVDAATRWGLAEGRLGGPLSFHMYILLANPQSTAANVTVTFLRETGSPVVATFIVPPTSRFNIDASAVPELHDESFGALIEVTNNVPIIVERSLYWDANGFLFSGGTNATGIRLP